MQQENRWSGAAANPTERGFTVIEGLIATAILLVVAIGIIPLFASSILNNTRGSDSTQASNFSKTSVETFASLPVNLAPLTLGTGQTELDAPQWWKPGNGQLNDPSQGWQSGTTTSVKYWTRNSAVQQYKASDIATTGSASTPWVGGTPCQGMVKMVTVNVQSSKQGGILGIGEQISLQLLKSVGPPGPPCS